MHTHPPLLHCCRRSAQLFASPMNTAHLLFTPLLHNRASVACISHTRTKRAMSFSSAKVRISGWHLPSACTCVLALTILAHLRTCVSVCLCVCACLCVPVNTDANRSAVSGKRTNANPKSLHALALYAQTVKCDFSLFPSPRSSCIVLSATLSLYLNALCAH